MPGNMAQILRKETTQLLLMQLMTGPWSVRNTTSTIPDFPNLRATLPRSFGKTPRPLVVPTNGAAKATARTIGISPATIANQVTTTTSFPRMFSHRESVDLETCLRTATLCRTPASTRSIFARTTAALAHAMVSRPTVSGTKRLSGKRVITNWNLFPLYLDGECGMCLSSSLHAETFS